MKRILLLICLFVSCIGISQTTEATDKKEILAVLKTQEKAWSAGDIETFMEGYWKSDSLRFFGASGITSGWDKTLANYKKAYPTKDHTGTLNFTLESFTKISNGVYYIMGRYNLQRKVGDAKGIFMIIFKKINGEWKIIADTSS